MAICERTCLCNCFFPDPSLKSRIQVCTMAEENFEGVFPLRLPELTPFEATQWEHNTFVCYSPHARSQHAGLVCCV